MTFTPADYHPDWPSIRRQILDQADHACEFCGAPNGETGDHDREGRWVDMETILHRYGVEGEGYHDDFPQQSRPVTVVLTIAHLCQEKRCIDPTHLRALCQRCHLNHDRPHHLAVQAENRRRRRVERGQLVLLP